MPELNTFSIVARCAHTAQLGAAVASAVPAVGALCLYLAPGVGAASTQSWVNPYLAIDALEAMRRGASSAVALAQVLAQDAAADARQLGLIGRDGPGMAHTGASCTAWCGQLTGDDYAIQGNMLAGEAVLGAMRRVWADSAGEDLAERLVRVLEAGDRAGGDRRGKQSAALKVLGREHYALVDLRVDEHVEPVAELRRLLRVASAQLLPFVAGMPRRDGVAAAPPEAVMRLLLRSPQER